MDAKFVYCFKQSIKLLSCPPTHPPTHMLKFVIRPGPPYKMLAMLSSSKIEISNLSFAKFKHFKSKLENYAKKKTQVEVCRERIGEGGIGCFFNHFLLLDWWWMLVMHLSRSISISFSYSNECQMLHEVYKVNKAQCSSNQLTLSVKPKWQCSSLIGWGVIDVLLYKLCDHSLFYILITLLSVWGSNKPLELNLLLLS